MSAVAIGELAALLEESLAVWHLSGQVVVQEDAMTVRAGERSLRIAIPPQGVPFRWMVMTAEKSRGVMSVSALLRTVRNALDPEHAGSRLRLAPQGMLPP